jgi:predicted ATPase/class 3 adenylate cyclase/DNA-binding CsgD family transcriptional regulator
MSGQMLAPVGASDEGDNDVAEVLPTGTVTLLLADVEGSTRLWEQRPDAMTEAIALLNEAASRLIAAHGGVRPIEQGEGDSFVAAFARASDAVACALELQRAEFEPIRLRIGVHTGEVQLRDEGNYAGPTINKAARLRDLAHGGQTVLSGAAEEMVEDRLPDQAWLTDLGSHALRDLPRPVRVAQLCHPHLRNDFPPLRAPNEVVTHHLPAQLTSFVGRGAELVDLRATVGGNRLVTLTGAGGAGKTRLAVEVAAQLTGDFPDGIWYADLAPITHPEVVPLAVARALGLPDEPGRSITETLLRVARDRHMLLVLDNCEHLLEAGAALVNDLLGSCPAVTVLATSREPLMVGGEVTWQVPSLSLDDEAIELFGDRARRGRPGFVVDETNAETVTEICRRLDGMPLAIELAAARVRSLTLDEIVGSLHDRFRLLTGGARTAVRRQQTLRASVDWSHALLTEPERVLFRRLSVFMGGFDLESAQAVAGASEVERFQVLDQLSLLVDKSLVSAENDGGTTRYRLLETVRQYAMEKLGESGEANQVRESHRDHYTAMAVQLDSPALASQWTIEKAEAEIDNLRAAFAWSLENDGADKAVEIASALQPLWLMRGQIQEGLAWLKAALTQEGTGDLAVRARALADKAVLDGWVGVDSVADAEEALAVARELDDPGLLIRALHACGSAAIYDTEAALRYFSEAIGLARALGDRWRMSQILGRQANAAFVSGDPVTALAIAQEGLDLANAIGDRFESRQCRFRIAGARCFQGDFAGGIALLRELLAETEADHDVMLRVSVLLTLAHVEAYYGDTDAALASAEASIEAAAELGTFYLGAANTGLMVAALAAGDVALAAEAADEALRGMVNGSGPTALNSAYFAQATLARGDAAEARRWADAAVAAMSGFYRSVALTTRARVFVALGEPEQAERDAYEALACAVSVKAYAGAPDILEVLAGLASDAGSHREAARLLGAADRIRRAGEARFKVYDADYHEVVTTVRDALGDTDFDEAWGEGDALSTDEAIAYAHRGRGERKRPSSGWGSLTPTELDVVRLVGEGLPNKDIATRLFVSPRTVQSHLRHVYTKLGFTSRVQLAQEATRRVAGAAST